MHSSTIVLNADYSYLNNISYQDAFRLLYQGKIIVLKYGDKVFRTIKDEFKVPLVVKLVRHIRTIYRKGIKWRKRNVFIRDNFTCQYCGKEKLRGIDCTVDHVTPKDQGGKNTFENTVTACFSCNNYKANRSYQECDLMFYKQGWMPYRPSISEFLMKKYKNSDLDGYFKELGIY